MAGSRMNRADVNGMDTSSFRVVGMESAHSDQALWRCSTRCRRSSRSRTCGYDRRQLRPSFGAALRSQSSFRIRSRGFDIARSPRTRLAQERLFAMYAANMSARLRWHACNARAGVQLRNIDARPTDWFRLDPVTDPCHVPKIDIDRAIGISNRAVLIGYVEFIARFNARHAVHDARRIDEFHSWNVVTNDDARDEWQSCEFQNENAQVSFFLVLA